jgi:hypothetical protein
MTNLSLSEADEELLSAYLDQELTQPERLELERRLVVESGLRQQLAELRKAFEMLGDLPNATLKPNFTQTTMEMVAINLEQEAANISELASLDSIAKKSRFQWRNAKPASVRWLTVGCIAVLVGSFIGWRFRVFSQKIELRTMAVAAYLPTLQSFPDMKLLKALTEIPYWEGLLDDKSVIDRMLPDPPHFEQVTNVRKWVSSLNVQQQSVLWKQHQELMRTNNFSSLNDVKYYLAIQEEPDHEKLLKAGSAFIALLNSMPSNHRDEILSLPLERQIIRLRQDAYYEIAINHTDRLSKEEQAAIVSWGQNEFEGRLREAMPFMKDAPLGRLLYFALYVLPQHSTMILPDHDELSASFCKGLSEKTSTLFQGVAYESQMLVMMAWLLRSGGWDEAKPPSNDELMEFYLQLPPESREEIDLADPTQAIEKLKNQYRLDQRFSKARKNQ